MPAYHSTHLTRSLVLVTALAAAATALVYHSPVLYARAENLQLFNSSLGNIPAPAIVLSNDEKRPFMVNDDTFPNFSEAATRTCDIQHNECNDAANAEGNKGVLRIADCDAQKASCQSFQRVAPKQNFDAVVAQAAPPVVVAPPVVAPAATANLGAATFPEFLGQDPNDPDFDLFCDP